MESKVSTEQSCSREEESTKEEIFHCETDDTAGQSQKGYTSIQDETSNNLDKHGTPTSSGTDNKDDYIREHNLHYIEEFFASHSEEIINPIDSTNKVKLGGEMDNQPEEAAFTSETQQPNQLISQSSSSLSIVSKDQEKVESPNNIAEVENDECPPLLMRFFRESANEMYNATTEHDNNIENQINDRKDKKQDASIKKSCEEHNATARDADNPEEDRSSLLGRNRRVRQKNRYFEDFHCIDLIKGARTSKEDLDNAALPTSSATRTSNRRSTTDSTRTSQDDIEALMSQKKYCRKCGSTTAHDDSGCQVCLFKSIVASNKRHQQRPSTKRDRSTNSKQQQPSRPDTQEPAAATPKTSSRPSSKSSSKSKRKATKQAGSSTKQSNNTLNKHPDSVLSNGEVCRDVKAEQLSEILEISPPIGDKIVKNNVNFCNEVVRNNKDHVETNIGMLEEVREPTETMDAHDRESDRLLYVDSWTPDEVADYIMSKGFPLEAELFKTQSVDGISLLLMQRTDFTYGLKMKLGPALKIYDRVCKLKREYFKTFPISQK